jgi:hypothetical protein
VDVRIGVTYSPREIDLQLGDDADSDALRAQVDEVLADETRVLWLTDKKGNQVGVPSSKIAYVEIGSSSEGRSFGFST